MVRLTHNPDDFVLTHTLMQRDGKAITKLWNRSISGNEITLPLARPPVLSGITIINNQGQVLLTDARAIYSDLMHSRPSAKDRMTAAESALYRIGDQPLMILYGKDGSVVRNYDFKTLAETLNTSPQDLIQSATVGYWRQGHPAFDASKEDILVKTYGKTLSIDMETGALSVL